MLWLLLITSILGISFTLIRSRFDLLEDNGIKELIKKYLAISLIFLIIGIIGFCGIYKIKSMYYQQVEDVSMHETNLKDDNNENLYILETIIHTKNSIKPKLRHILILDFEKDTVQTVYKLVDKDGNVLNTFSSMEEFECYIS